MILPGNARQLYIPFTVKGDYRLVEHEKIGR
jgi:hypothetical protein